LERDRAATGQYQRAYLDRVAAFVDQVRGHGIYVLLDFHEDGYSKELCEDGAPLWAITPLPSPLPPGGAVLEPGQPDCHVAPEALAAHVSFFADTNGLQEAFIAMVKQVALRFRDDQSVLGYELFNEPLGSWDQAEAFSAKAAAALRQVDARHLVFWEPSATRNITDYAPIPPKPFTVPGTVYTVHIYSSKDGDWMRRLDSSAHGAHDEAEAWGTPLFVSEHGCDSNALGEAWTSRLFDDFDQDRVSSTYWIWNPGLLTRNSDGSFAFTDGGKVLATLSRPYAPAVGGDIDSVRWDSSAGELTVAFHGHRGVPAIHDVYWNQGTPAITCDGAATAATRVDTDGQLYTVSCGGAGSHTLVFKKG
jgi:endoglycosylceramidase